MGKKTENTAQVMFEELLEGEIKGENPLSLTHTNVRLSENENELEFTDDASGPHHDGSTQSGQSSNPPPPPPQFKALKTSSGVKKQASEMPSSEAKSQKPSAKNKSKKAKFEGIDPLFQDLLVHPDEVSEVGSVPHLIADQNSDALNSEDSEDDRDLDLQNVFQQTGTVSPQQDEDIDKILLNQDDVNVVAHFNEKAKDPAQHSANSDAVAFLRNSDKTQKIQVAKVIDAPQAPPMHFTSHAGAISGTSLEEQLRSANYLELAQNRVLELEKDVQRLRRDNEQLASAGQHFKELTETIKQQLRQAEANFTNLKEISEEEKRILTQSLEAKEIKIGALQDRLVELEEKINSSFDHVRIRERELENRLEIMKTESEALTTSKDEMILDLKKQLNLVNSDLEKYRIQNQKITAKMESKEEMLRRTVKALRIALTMLEGSRPDED